MKKLAKRTDLLAQSDIRAVTAMVNRVGGINLGQGICDLPTPDPIKKGAEAAIEANKSIYTAYTGIPELQHAILHKARTFNQMPVASPDEVMVSNGSTGAFVTALMAILEPQDEIILFEPYYGYHKNLIHVLGGKTQTVTARGANWTIDFDEVRAKINANTKAMVINTPSNPCGKVWTQAELQEALAIAQEHDLYIITDEIYEYMTYDAHRHISLASLPDAYERTITISGFSKTYNMTGWRLGYAIAPPPIIEKMGLLNDMLYVCAPAPLQYGLAEAFMMSDDYFTQMMVDYTNKRKMMCDALTAIGFDAPLPQGAYYVLANFEALSKTRAGFEDDRTACETLVQATGVASVPGNSFFNNPADGRYFLRFCYAKEYDILGDACERLGKMNRM
jgi:aminotransferase